MSQLSRDRSYGYASSGNGSESDPPRSNTPQRRKKNNRNGTGRGGGGGGRGGHNNHHNNSGGGGGGHRHHEMTLLCHRVDVFDDFVPRKSGDSSCMEGLVPIRCLTPDRGCACSTPCKFCHMVEEHDGPDAASDGSDSSGDIPPNLAILFGDKASLAEKQPPSEKKEPSTKTVTSISLVVDPIFAQNHGLISDAVEGGIKVKKYHHPPVGRYNFTPPLLELPKFFDHDPGINQYQHAESNPDSVHKADAESSAGQESKEATKDESSNGLDSFFDDFTTPKPPPPSNNTQKHVKQKKHTDNDQQVLVFRAPLKTVVRKTIASSDVNWKGKCLCQSRYDNLMKGSTQPNPHDPSVVHDKYWAQRRRLFKKFDEGIQLDPQGWYSVTPEVVADHVASRFAEASAQLMRGPSNNNSRDARGGGSNRRGGQRQKPQKSMVILDAFCGCGGNAIAFARLPPSVVSLVVCIEIDRTKLRKAAHNASIYGIPPNRILFVEANSVAVMQRCYRDGNLIMDPPPRASLAEFPPREVYDDFTIGGMDLLPEYAPHIDAVFMDPPWGGVDYGAMGKDGYDLTRDMRIKGCERGCVGFPPTPEVDGVRLLRIAAAATSTRFVAYDLPRNTNKRSLAHAALDAGYSGNSKLEEHYLNGRLKTVTAYFGQDFRHLLDLKKYHKP